MRKPRQSAVAFHVNNAFNLIPKKVLSSWLIYLLTMKKLKFLFLAAFAAFSNSTEAQNLILNPGFENHSLTAQCYTNQPASFVTTSLDNVTAFYGGSMDGIDIGVSTTCYAGGANSGTTHIVVAGLSGPNMFESFSFDLSSPIMAGSEYSLSFYAANSNVANPESLKIGVSAVANAFGTQTALVALGNNSAYTQYSTTFVAAASGNYLTIEPGALGNFWFGLDDFYLELNCSATSNSFTTSACDAYTVPSGDSTYTVSGIYNDTIPNAAGCDSILTIDLTINTLDLTVTQSGMSLTANETAAVYQWLECPGMGAVAGATNQTFSPTANGDYAVIISKNGCTDTSSCSTIAGLGLKPSGSENKVLAYPNPTNGEITFSLNNSQSENDEIKIIDLQGKIILSQKIIGSSAKFDLSQLDAGVYFWQLNNGTTGKLVKR